jgi:predicted TIM-barrel fold metal-dependent hydrolase
MIFGRGEYPFAHLAEPLRRAIDAFGAERVMWSGDSTVITTGESWAENLFYLRDSALGLSLDEQAWVLGRTVRTVLQWPAIVTPHPRQAEFEAIEAEYRHGPRE